MQNPVCVASGTFGYAQECESLVELNSLGGIFTKAITLQPRQGNPPPRIAETTAGMLNSIGLANVGVERFIQEKLPFLRTLKPAIFVNVAGSSADEYFQVIERLEQAEGIDGYEINVSCPNVKHGGMQFGTSAANVKKLSQTIRQITTRTLIIKLTPNVTNIAEIAAAAEQGGADAISLINTLRGMAIDLVTHKPKLATIFGGLSGPAIKPVALAKVFEVSRAVSLPIIGLGGIMNYSDALEFILAGATAIQIGTGTFINPKTAENIIKDLTDYCRENHFQKIRELIGGLKI